MQHFYKSIPGWYNELPELYSKMVQYFPSGSHFVEVGSFQGSSASCMAVEIINSGKSIKFDCVDTWLGSEEHQTYSEIQNNTLFEKFVENMKPVEGYYQPLRMTSLEASKLYADNSLDFVCIDAAHDYDNVKADILAWLPKVKPGGVLGGDDFFHPPVAKAVQELLQPVEGRNYWLYKKH